MMERERRHEERRDQKQRLRGEGWPGPGKGPPPPPPERPWLLLPRDPEARRAERERLKGEIGELRLRLEEAGNSEAGRRRPTWWDLPSRRNQGMRLRHLRHLRHELDRRLDRLEQLREAEPEPGHPDRKRAEKHP